MGAGIFLSRVAGFGRDVAIAAFFGTTVAADAYAAALRIPNIIRNLLGEGTLSASFIPVYSGLLGREAEGDARKLAGNVLGLLLVLAAALSALGILLAPWLTRLLVPGWPDESVGLTTRLVRILFPMAGFMVLAAWCLGVLNSHRRFFLSFAAPVVWNLSQIAGLLIAWRAGWEPLVVALAWSTLIGGALQFLIQLPTARRLAGKFKLSLQTAWGPVRRVVQNFGPVVLGQGVAQVASLLDVFLASFLVHGAVAALYYSQRLYFLPVSLFGISVAASSLPELSREADSASYGALRERLKRGFRNVVFMVLPSCVALILFGDWVVALLFQRGDFLAEDTAVVHGTLAAYSIGLLAASSVKLFASGFHAMLDTRTPVRYAVVGLVIGAGTGATLMWPLYAPGLAVGTALGSWCYLLLLWKGLGSRIGKIFTPGDVLHMLKVGAACAAAAAVGLAVVFWFAPVPASDARLVTRIWVTAGALGSFGVVYLAATRLLGAFPADGLRVWSDGGS
ncbi:MAG: murein biosynthesis integral membrane protein MurJ [Gemmatimonadota bacterium]|nr:MAG: murein biosynthesis integral membrane protein MurJ [Gemmatimonadota bacterium]